MTTRTSPSAPACVFTMRAIGQRIGANVSSLSTTTSPTARLWAGRRHLWSFCRVTRYSEDHRCQKCRSRDWHKCHRLSAVMGRSSMSEFGIASRGLPMRKCPGVKASMPSSSSGRGTSGLLLRHASIWHKTVESSSKLSFTLPTIRARCFFRLLTAASHNPPKWGASLG